MSELTTTKALLKAAVSREKEANRGWSTAAKERDAQTRRADKKHATLVYLHQKMCSEDNCVLDGDCLFYEPQSPRLTRVKAALEVHSGR